LENPNLKENAPALWLSDFPRVQAHQHKYDRGHALIFGGPITSTGATVLAANAALRIGAGLVSVATSREALPVYAAHFRAVMTKAISQPSDFAALIEDTHVRAVLLGPGAGVTDQTKASVLAALQSRKATVLDADALNVFAAKPESLFEAIDGPCILTPHTGEFARLFGVHTQSAEVRIAAARAAAAKTRAVVILKGNHTVIASPEGAVAINRNATPYLATAGAGDVLAGICTGLLAQGMPAFSAACAGVWLHGAAGSAVGAGLIAEDIAGQLPFLLRSLLETPSAFPNR